MSAPRWDSLGEWDAFELLDAFVELRDQLVANPNDYHVDTLWMAVQGEVLRRCAR